MNTVRSITFWQLWSMSFEEAVEFSRKLTGDYIKVAINKKGQPIDHKLIVNLIDAGAQQSTVAKAIGISQQAVSKIYHKEKLK